MPDRTKIEWCDATWNPIAGCRHVSEGCRNCYAEVIAARFSTDPAFAGTAAFVNTADGSREARWTGRVVVREHLMTAPLHWRKPKRIFVNSVSDLFHDEVPDSIIDQVFAVMALAPQHTFMVLTKRPERMRKYLAPYDTRRADNLGRLVLDLGYAEPLECLRWPLPNVQLGVSVEDQVTADMRIPYLLDTPAAVRFASYEPALGPVDWRWSLSRHPYRIAAGFLQRGHFAPGAERLRPLDGVLMGGETGPRSRPTHPDWARQTRDQCAEAGAAFHLKGWGDWAPFPDGTRVMERLSPSRREFWNNATEEMSLRVGRRQAGRLLDGVEHNALPGVQHA